MRPDLEGRMTNTNQIITSSGYKCPILQENNRVRDSGALKIELDMDIDPEKVARGKCNHPIVQYPNMSYNSTITPSLQSNASKTDKASNQCDLLNQETLPVSNASNNLRDSRHVHMSPSPPPVHSRRPSYPLYFPSEHYSPKKEKRVPFKRPISSPLYLPTDTDYYPTNVIAQGFRRRRSITPPFKEHKRFFSKFHLLPPPNNNNEIWSIPREVGMVVK